MEDKLMFLHIVIVLVILCNKFMRLVVGYLEAILGECIRGWVMQLLWKHTATSRTDNRLSLFTSIFTNSLWMMSFWEMVSFAPICWGGPSSRLLEEKKKNSKQLSTFEFRAKSFPSLQLLRLTSYNHPWTLLIASISSAFMISRGIPTYMIQ